MLLNKTIAKRLGLSEVTVRSCISEISGTRTAASLPSPPSRPDTDRLRI
ncbi:helix-turn-helix domain-containing protein [Bifidobacterium sp.]